jgi:hypothetical protein
LNVNGRLQSAFENMGEPGSGLSHTASGNPDLMQMENAVRGLSWPAGQPIEILGSSFNLHGINELANFIQS